ncbi:MAG TPA: hypothetical protein VHD31_02830 [Candidatus Paceibacterota bacterium]|nr:hypothetical protein [Candidatus Paceibacterota bacterium]
MKRILFSLGTIIFVGAVATASTGAFFSDTETSAGNIFTAGSIDLKVDHSLSTYNGNAAATDLVVVSDPQTQVDSHAAVVITDTPITTQYWTASSSPLLASSTWIWSENPAANDAINSNVQKTFTRTFNWTGTVTSASLAITADNRYKATLNGHDVDLGAGFASNDQHVSADSYIIDPSWINQGVNTLVVLGQNDAQSSPPDQVQNPAGVRFRLEVHGAGNTWSDPIDLTGQPIWNFDDVKPADQGRDVLSLHVATNDAWACMEVGNVRNNENDLIDPEIDAGDAGPANGLNGELGQYLQLFLWHDLNQDGIYNPPTETPVGAGTYTNIFNSSGTTTLAIHDSTTLGGPLLGNTTDYIGSAWCAGTLSVDGSGAISCDGSSVSNAAQTDSTLADITFYATQSRNNSNFTCSSLNQQ